MPFDIQAARAEGYTDSDIIGYLTKSRKFDVAGARQEGYSEAEILEHLAKAAAQAQPAPRGGDRQPEMVRNSRGGLTPAAAVAARKAEPEYRPGLADKIAQETIGYPARAAAQGVTRMAGGLKGLAKPGLDAKAGAVSEVARGAMEAASPLLLPAMMAAPVATVAGVGAGLAGQTVGEAGAKALGAGPGVSALAGDVMGSAAGGFAAKKAPGAAAVLAAKAKGAMTGPGVSTMAKGAAEVAGGAAAVASGEPLSGAAAVLDGMRRVKGGLAERRAAAMERMAAMGPEPVPTTPVAPEVLPERQPNFEGMGGGSPLRPPVQAKAAEVAAEPPAIPTGDAGDPFTGTEAYRRGVEAMLARRAGTQKPANAAQQLAAKVEQSRAAQPDLEPLQPTLLSRGKAGEGQMPLGFSARSYEQAARDVKAMDLSDALFAAGVDSEVASRMRAEDWKLTAQMATRMKVDAIAAERGISTTEAQKLVKPVKVPSADTVKVIAKELERRASLMPKAKPAAEAAPVEEMPAAEAGFEARWRSRPAGSGQAGGFGFGPGTVKPKGGAVAELTRRRSRAKTAP